MKPRISYQVFSQYLADKRFFDSVGNKKLLPNFQSWLSWRHAESYPTQPVATKYNRP